MKTNNPRILLFIGMERNVGRDVMAGIVNYSNIHGPWQFFSPLPFYATPRSRKMQVKDIMDWKPDGAILIEHEKDDPIQEVLNLGIPTILSYSSRSLDPQYPTITSDNAAIGTMGAEHFLGLGFRYYAFCGYKKLFWSEERLNAFSKKVDQEHHHFDYYEFGRKKSYQSWEQEHDSLKDWLLGLKKPVALMACNDDFARDILITCQSIGILVPDEIAILGVDNEELTCKICTPHLSSISLDFEYCGYQAAEALESLINNPGQEVEDIVARPLQIQVRASTDIIAIEDPEVAAAIRFIRENAIKPIQVQDVAHAACVSRRALEIRFRKLIGHTLHKQIRQVRVNKIVEIMLSTNLPLSKIMQKNGFTDKHIARWFKAEKGMNPSEFREKFRQGL